MNMGEILEPGDHADDWRDKAGHWHYADCGACRPEGCCCCCPTPDDQP